MSVNFVRIIQYIVLKYHTVKVMLKFNLEGATKAQKGRSSIALLFL